MIVYAIDERWDLTSFPHWQQITAKHRANGTSYAVVHPLIKPADDLTSIALKIKLAVREKGEGAESIWLLRLCAHGFCGFLQLGAGLRWYKRNEIISGFSELASYMTPGGPGVEMWGCGIGSESDVREIGSLTGSGLPEFRPGSIPKAFVRQSNWDDYYRRGQFGKLGGLASHGTPAPVTPGRSTLELLHALSYALKVRVTAPIHAQPAATFTRLHGPTVTVLSTDAETYMRLDLRPDERASVKGPLSQRR